MVDTSAVQTILVVNLHSSQNAGDAVLLQTTVKQLQDAMPEAQIVLAQNDLGGELEVQGVRRVGSFLSHVLSIRSDRTVQWDILRLVRYTVTSAIAALWYRVYGRLPSWLPGELKPLLAAYVAADLVVSCPGNVFFTMGRVGLPFLVSAFTTAYALLLRRPLYIMPQSVGPLHRRWERIVVRAIFSRAGLAFVREPLSLRLVRALGLDSDRCRLSPDLAFTFPAAPSEMAAALLDQLDLRDVHPRVGVTVISRMVRSVDRWSWERYQESMAAALARFHAAHGGRSVFFPQVTGPTLLEDDRVTAEQVVARMTPPERALLVRARMPPGLLKAVYGHMDIFIATRMHSGIFALSQGVPTLFVAYLHKTFGLVEMLGMEEWAIDIEEASEALLLRKMESLWEQREAVRRHLQRVVPGLLEQASGVGLSIAEDYRERQATRSVHHRRASHWRTARRR